MPGNRDLLKQLRATAAAIRQTIEHPEQKAQLAAADIVLNELLLRDSPDFHIDYLERGKALLAEGRKLAANTGKPLKEDLALRDDVSTEASFHVIQSEIDKLQDCLLA